MRMALASRSHPAATEHRADHTRRRRRSRLALLAAGALASGAAAAAASCSSTGNHADDATTPTAAAPATAATPATATQPARSPLAAPAAAYFWEAFSAGRYDERTEVLQRLTAAFAEDNTDGEIALLIAQTHLWIVCERARVEGSSDAPDVIDQLGLAEQFFEQAAALRPDDRRIPGWIAAAQMQLARATGDRALFERAYAAGRAAWKAYPEFNGFTFAYALSAEPTASPEFENARVAMWETARLCSGGRVTRSRPDAGPSLEALGEPNPICGNTPLAPHNFEGFWWILGQFESKGEQIDRARACFTNVQVSPGFENWPVSASFEQDVTDVYTLNSELRADPARLVFNTTNSCMACHQAR